MLTANFLQCCVQILKMDHKRKEGYNRQGIKYITACLSDSWGGCGASGFPSQALLYHTSLVTHRKGVVIWRSWVTFFCLSCLIALFHTECWYGEMYWKGPFSSFKFYIIHRARFVLPSIGKLGGVSFRAYYVGLHAHRVMLYPRGRFYKECRLSLKTFHTWL